MVINFDNALGIHPKALALRAERSDALAANLANADTPGYKARDIEFSSVLKKTLAAPLKPERTNPGHLALGHELLDGKLMYRVPSQPSLDGNTVETQIEQGKFLENSLQYQASLRFLSGSFAGLITALRGE